MTADSRPTVIGFWCRLISGILVAAFCHWTGRAIWRVGIWCRPWLPPEFAHKAFLRNLKWTCYEPPVIRKALRHD
jgi:hypothetical protein